MPLLPVLNESIPPGACSHVQSCPLFPKFHMASSLRYWVEAYCFTEFRTCKRYESMSTGKPPSPTLLPNGKDLHAFTR